MRVRFTSKADGGAWLVTSNFIRRAAFVLLGVALCLLTGVASTAQPNAKNVLVLSGGRGHWSIDQMEASLRSHVPFPVNFSDTDLESPNFEDPSYRQSLANELMHGFAAERPDLVVAVMDPSLQFAVEYHDRIFPGVPIVFMSVSSPRAKQMSWRWPGVTGVASPVGIRETIDLALRLHPNTNSMAVISGLSGTETEYFEAVHDELAHYRDRVQEIDIVGLPGREMIEKVEALRAHTVVLYQLWPVDSKSAAFGSYDLLATVAKRLPTYCIFSGLCLDHGGIGGSFDDPKNDAALAGILGARILSGQKPEDVPVAQNSRLETQVDWRQLRHWDIPESALPQGSVILFRPPSLWEQYRKYVIAALAVIAALLLLVIALLWERARKRKAEAVLRESEERFRRMADTTPSLIWMCDEQGKISYLNERWLGFAGSDPDAGYGDTWFTYIHPDDVKSVLNATWQALTDHQPFSKEYRLHRNDGTYRWMFDVASPRLNGDGTFAGFIGSAIDVTDQKLAQQALEQVSGQLIEAQEKERTRIARDLHDDICQRLALLSMELEQVKRESKGRVSATKSIEEIRLHCSEIAGDVQSLSHQLHSSKLDYLGIGAALRGLCKEFSKQHQATVDFTDSNVPGILPRDVSLCLFRIAQEALQNAMKYSGTNRFKVELSATKDGVRLQVSDSGLGFDVEDAKKNRGLGLVSMQERVNLVHGQFSVESRHGAGTTISASVPIIAEKESSFEDGVARETAGTATMG